MGMYCESLINYCRFLTKRVLVGDIVIGDAEDIKLQTMTNTSTKDVASTVGQIERSVAAGADLVRVTVPTKRSIEPLADIHSQLSALPEQKPLVADVHFSRQVALASAEIVEKVRINPGNFIKSKETLYSDAEYQEELNKTEEICKSLIEKCKEHKTAIRIGTNHGSLSPRIVGRYGNTAEGLVQATIEYIRIFVRNGFENLVVSLKSSNPTVMIQANRLLVAEMRKNNLCYPIHLGVTEAGNQRDGRIKSAIGIGALLIDGVGDTVRVSLSEKPENEIPVARKIVDYVVQRASQTKLPEVKTSFFNPYSFERRKTYAVQNIGGSKPPVVISSWLDGDFEQGEHLPDYVLSRKILSLDLPQIVPLALWQGQEKVYPLCESDEYLASDISSNLIFVSLSERDLSSSLLAKAEDEKNVVFVPKILTDNIIGELRLFYSKLYDYGSTVPVVLQLEYLDKDFDDYIIKCAVDSSTFLIDGLADGLCLLGDNRFHSQAQTVDTAFDILQSSGRRLSKTDFISCPSCGRTLFDLEKVIDTVKNETKHLKGLKIAIMGCIVNGPGEVADADYGYIGSGVNKVTLFKGNKPVKKNLNEDIAVKELINLIKENGDWVAPS